MSGAPDDPARSISLPLEILPDVLVTFQLEKKPHTVLDVREAWELDICKLEDCLHIPLGDLARRIDELPLDRPLVVVCHTGRRSLMATQFLRSAGMDQATNLTGGVETWATDIDPSMPRY